RIIASLHQEFSMTDLGYLNYFMGNLVTRGSSGMFLSQRKYATELLERANMAGCNSSRTPVDPESKLGDDGDPVSDPTLYRSLAGSLQYLTFTRPDVSYAVQHKIPQPTSLSNTTILCLCTGTRKRRLTLRGPRDAVYLSSNPVHHQRTKRTDIDIYFVRDLIAAG
nr:ribonuclease H-like domain-containing protein [Tanacetum cinerariifolium]